MTYLRNKKGFDSGLLLSQSLNFKAYKTCYAAIYFKIVQKQKYAMSILGYSLCYRQK